MAHINRIETDESLRSLLTYGSPAYPFEFYHDYLGQYESRRINLHWHPVFECSYVASGKVRCRIFSSTYDLEKGDALFINTGAVHYFEDLGNGELKNLLFDPTFIAAEDSLIYDHYVRPITEANLTHFVIHKENARMGRLLQKIADGCKDAEKIDDPLRMLKTQGHINQIWQSLYPKLMSFDDTIFPSHDTQKRVQKMLDHIHSHYHQKLSVADLANAANISKREALRSFSQQLGITPIAYLNNYRLRMAAEELSGSSLSVTRIALENGFDNAGYFCKVFKKEFGLSPRQYRLQFHYPSEH